jgi:serine/threonine-protein phosphatase 2A regulatory subunit A
VRSRDKFQVRPLCRGSWRVANDISGFCALLERETLLHDVMPSIEELVSDQSQHVRAALGTQISGLAPILGKEE